MNLRLCQKGLGMLMGEEEGGRALSFGLLACMERVMEPRNLRLQLGINGMPKNC